MDGTVPNLALFKVMYSEIFTVECLRSYLPASHNDHSCITKRKNKNEDNSILPTLIYSWES